MNKQHGLLIAETEKSHEESPAVFLCNYLYYKGLLHPAKRFCRIRPIIGRNGAKRGYPSMVDHPHQSSSDRFEGRPIGLPGGAGLARAGEN